MIFPLLLLALFAISAVPQEYQQYAFMIIILLAPGLIMYHHISQEAKKEAPKCPPHKYRYDSDGELICSVCRWRPKDSQ